MKEIDPKSLIIGVLATALVFACTDSNNNQKAGGVPSLVTEAHAATSKDDRGKWDDDQKWQISRKLWDDLDGTKGWEPFAITDAGFVYLRARTK